LSHAPVLFAVGIFQIASCFNASQVGCWSPIYVSCIAGRTGVYHHSQLLFVEDYRHEPWC
jgi:hypothetical protein